MDSDDSAKSDENENGEDDDHRRGDDGVSKNFPLLNSLSDLLMLPKDMLLNKSIRKEVNSRFSTESILDFVALFFDALSRVLGSHSKVCPMIGLPLITRILCNFAPDEFCPDPVPGIILEELNAEVCSPLILFFFSPL